MPDTIYRDITHELQKIEQSAARLAGDAPDLSLETLRARIDAHERAVVFTVIQLCNSVERLAREAGQ